MNIENVFINFDLNIKKIENILNLHKYVEKNKDDLNEKLTLGTEDLLRSCIVNIHASFEDFLRNLLSVELPNCNDKDVISKIGFIGKRPEEKIKLLDLIEYKNSSIQEIFALSIKDFLSKKSFNNIDDIIWVLQVINIKITQKLETTFKTIEEMIIRRHKIVHEADYSFDKDGNSIYGDVDLALISEYIKCVLKFIEIVRKSKLDEEWDIEIKQVQNNSIGLSPTFELFQDLVGQYRFRFKLSNGRIILASEGYSSKDGCENGIEAVKRNGAIIEAYHIKESSKKGFYFSLKAQNGQTIGVSTLYKHTEELKKDINLLIQSFKKMNQSN